MYEHDQLYSESPMDRYEVKDAYGEETANRYLVYQVIVRNLNADKEFLIHDVQVAVEDHRVIGGRDKAIARGVAIEGQAMEAICPPAPSTPPNAGRKPGSFDNPFDLNGVNGANVPKA
jgi:hypothetical protein